MPRRVHITGALDAHDVGLDEYNHPVRIRLVDRRRPEFWPPDHKYERISLADRGITVVDECDGELRSLSISTTFGLPVTRRPCIMRLRSQSDEDLSERIK